MKKKIIYGICMLGLVALVTTSCKKKEETTSTFEAELIQMEDDFANGERVYINPSTLKIWWQEGDHVKLYNMETNKTAMFTVQSTGTNTTIKGASVGNPELLYAFYPYEMATADYEDNAPYQTFELVSTFHCKKTPGGDFTFGDKLLPMAARTNGKKFSFKPIFGFARFNIACEGNEANPGEFPVITKLVLHDNHFNLSGTCTLKPKEICLNGDGLTEVMAEFKEGTEMTSTSTYQSYVIETLGYSAVPTGKDITLIFDGGYTARLASPAVCYFGLRPGALAYGFTLDIYLESGQMITIDTFNREDREHYTIEPNRINTFSIDITDDVIWD